MKVLVSTRFIPFLRRHWSQIVATDFFTHDQPRSANRRRRWRVSLLPADYCQVELPFRRPADVRRDQSRHVDRTHDPLPGWYGCFPVSECTGVRVLARTMSGRTSKRDPPTRRRPKLDNNRGAASISRVVRYFRGAVLLGARVRSTQSIS